jgi:pilus assembly protein FimV
MPVRTTSSRSWSVSRAALAVLAASAMALCAVRADALSLGDARVTSGLNAPLVAEIAVLEATPAELRVLRAEIPGRDVFTRYGLDWPGFLATASVTLRTSGDGTPVLVLRTQQAVSEPFITVLVAANWGRGRVLREYNLIVDRPNETAEGLPPVEVQGPVVDAGREGAIERDTAQGAMATPSSAAAQDAGAAAPPERVTLPGPSRPRATSAGSIDVRRGDTLGRIAAGVARDLGVTRSQALVGLYQANPEAFGASMNDLRTGAVLRIPDVAELEALPPTLVAREVDRAVADWRQRSGVPTRVADPGGRLRLVAPSEVSVGTGGDATAKGSEGAAKSGAAGQAGQSASPTSDETVEQRLARIERELIERQRLLEVTQSQLAELQARAAASPQAADAGLFAPLQALLGKAWWLWFLVLAAVWALVSWAMAARRRAASAESELDTYLRTRTATSAGVGMDDRVAEAVAPVPAPAAVAATSTDRAAPSDARSLPPELFDDLEGDPPMPDEAGNKLDLARAFIEMGDPAAARIELEHVLASGDEAQREDARRLLDSLA